MYIEPLSTIMKSKITKILIEYGYENLISFLSDELTESELNSLLLDVFMNKSKLKKASQILKDYSENRFVKPSTIDPIANTEIELQILKILNKVGFEVMEFSPLAPFGTVSIHNTVHQNNVVSGLRRIEVVSDITNVLALEASKRTKENSKIDRIDLASSHRQVRAQGFDNPNYTAHFKVIGLVTSWIDRGQYKREEESIIKHIKTYVEIFRAVYGLEINDLVLRLNVLANSDDIDFKRFMTKVEKCVEDLESETTYELNKTNEYYSILRFGIQIRSMDYPIVDGGFVNWISKFTQNKKQRILISGIGTELMYKIMNSQ